MDKGSEVLQGRPHVKESLNVGRPEDDLKYFKVDRMSCHTFSANYFRLFLYAAAFVMANKIKRTLFKDTEVERFTMDSFIKRIMLSAVYITEKKTCVRISFSPNHRHRAQLEQALAKAAA